MYALALNRSLDVTLAAERQDLKVFLVGVESGLPLIQGPVNTMFAPHHLTVT
jgi:hypothetical protein